MIGLIIGIMLLAFTIFACVPGPLGWWQDILVVLRGSIPILTGLVGVVSILIGIANIKDSSAEKKDEAASKGKSSN